MDKIGNHHSQGNSSGSSQPVSNIRPKVPYFDMIAEALVASPRRKMILKEIYNYISDKYPYFEDVNPKGWKSGVRHNLSVNSCFIKVGKCKEHKGHYWAVHPASYEDFARGDYNHKNAKQKVQQANKVLQKAREAQKANETVEAQETLQRAIMKQQQQEVIQQQQATAWPSYPQPPQYRQPTLQYQQQLVDRSKQFTISNLLNLK